MAGAPNQASLVERLVFRGTRIAALVILVVLVAPMIVIVPLSLTSGTLLIYPLPGLSGRWYEEFFTERLWVQATWNSVLIAVPTTVLATTLGTFAALGLNRLRSRLVPAVAVFLITPLIVPVIIYAVSAFYFYSRLGIVGTYPGLIFGHTALAIPFVVVTVNATLKNFDANLLRAALVLGATPRQAFARVTLPLILPGVLSGGLFAFITSFDELILTLFVASPEQRTLPRQLWSGVQETINPTIAAAAVVLMLVSVLVMLLAEWLRRQGRRIQGKQ
ncbi:ABC transporter permease [Paralimibaculum aggregatum]|uniref:ABC transporter permease n=1 Tax=Paralimibaculum aggregatum TaxID=3036245 RepID=A0ABQ6LS96_9RHOB|nr:ABC transporter permease [Limibaculum sp. NKW23]GMG84831.1 ABC transporter permease [Limibaculum sp. NKW23]